MAGSLVVNILDSFISFPDKSFSEYYLKLKHGQEKYKTSPMKHEGKHHQYTANYNIQIANKAEEEVSFSCMAFHKHLANEFLLTQVIKVRELIDNKTHIVKVEKGKSSTTLAFTYVPSHTEAVVPTSPYNLAFSDMTTSSLVLSWVAPAYDSGHPVSEYRVTYSTDPKVEEGVQTLTVASPSTSSKVTGLERGTPYYFHVAAISDVGISPESFVAYASTLAEENQCPAGSSAPADQTEEGAPSPASQSAPGTVEETPIESFSSD